MIESKRYVIEEIGNMFRVLKDKEPLTTKFENTDKQDVINLIGELNELNYKNNELKYKNELLSDELEQCKAVINKKWSEYLKKNMEGY